MLVAVSLYWLTTIGVGTGYGDIWPSFVLMGLGMALVMSPMSTAAMNAVSVSKAGVASGILSMNRMVGGTLGIAVIGAVFAVAGARRAPVIRCRVRARLQLRDVGGDRASPRSAR